MSKHTYSANLIKPLDEKSFRDALTFAPLGDLIEARQDHAWDEREKECAALDQEIEARRDDLRKLREQGYSLKRIADIKEVTVAVVKNLLRDGTTPAVIPAAEAYAPALVTLNGTALTPENHAEIGQQLTRLYHDAQAAELAILRFGAAFWAVEQGLKETVSTRGHGGKFGDKGSGFKGWLEKFAPEISRPTAIRYRDIAAGIAEKFSIADPVAFFSSAPEALPLEEQKKRAEVIDFVSEKSVRAIQLELGLTTATEKPEKAPAKGDKVPAPKMESMVPKTATQRHEKWVAAARQRAIDTFSELHDLDDRWKLMTEEQIRLAAADAKRFAAEADKWLKADPATRLQCEVAKHLGEEVEE